MIDNWQTPQERRLGTRREDLPGRHGSLQEWESAGYDAGIGRLLDRELPVLYRREWTERIASENSKEVPGIRSVVIFRLGEEWLALPTHIVQEVTEHSKVHGIPHHRHGVLIGLASVRGNLLVCVSLGAMLGLREIPRARQEGLARTKHLLIVQHPAGPLALPVDEVAGVHRYHPNELKELPATLSQASAMYTSGLLPWRGKTVGCLDKELVFYTLNKGLL